MRKNIFITIGIVSALLVAFFLGHTGSSARAASASAAVPAQATQLGEWIEQQSAIFNAQQKRADDANAIVADATAKKNQAQQSALGYRYALCEQFHLQEITLPQGTSHFVAATTDCSNFQSGTPAAQQ